MQGSACTDLSSAEPISRVTMVREFRAQANCSLKVAMDAVNNGWCPGDLIPLDAVQLAQKEYDAWHRLRDAAPDLLEALIFVLENGFIEESEAIAQAAISRATGSEAK